MKTVIRLLIFVLVLTGLAPVSSAYADCNNPSISSVTQTPSGNSVPQGTTLTFRVQANCGTIRIAANNNVFYELGSPDVTATFDTTPFGGQSIVFMAQVRGDNQTWDQTNSRVWSVSVQPGSNSQPTSVGADLNGFCRYLSYDRVGTPGNAYQMHCDWGDQEVAIDMYALCEWQTGGAMPYPGLSDPYDWRTWTCNTNPTYIAPPPVEQPSQPSQPSNPAPSNPVPSNPQPSGGNNNPSNGGSSNNSSSSSVCQRSAPISVGDLVQVTPGEPNRFRATPSLSGSSLGNIPAEVPFTITGGPRWVDGYCWWQLTFNGRTGWTADGEGSVDWLEPVGNNPAINNQPTTTRPTQPSSGNNNTSNIGQSDTYNVPCSQNPSDGCYNGVNPLNATVIFVNGIANTAESNKSSIQMMADSLPNEKISGIFNGGLSDNLGNTDTIMSEATRNLRQYLEERSCNVIIIAHSQGGDVTADAIRSLEPNCLRSLAILTFGSPALSYVAGPEYLHCSFFLDPVTSVSRFVVGPKIIWDENGIAFHDFREYWENRNQCLDGGN